MKKNNSTRRQFLNITTKAAISIPFINLGTFRPFPFTNSTYSKRTMDLMTESLVIDMLSILDMGKMFTAPAKGANPLQFSKEELMDIKA